MRYPIVTEGAERNSSAHVPDLSGCVALGATVAGAETRIRQAVGFHAAGLSEDGVPAPRLSHSADCAGVPA